MVLLPLPLCIHGLITASMASHSALDQTDPQILFSNGLDMLFNLNSNHNDEKIKKTNKQYVVVKLHSVVYLVSAQRLNSVSFKIYIP